MPLVAPVSTLVVVGTSANFTWTPATGGVAPYTYFVQQYITVGFAGWNDAFDVGPALHKEISGFAYGAVVGDMRIKAVDAVGAIVYSNVINVVIPAGESSGFKLVFKVGGMRVDPTSVEITDPTGTRGIWDRDSGFPYLGPGAAMSRTGLGTFTYILTGPPQAAIAGRTLEWFGKVTYQGTAYYFFRQTRDGVTLPVSAYFSWDEFIRRWGLGNVAIASNKDNATKAPDYDAVQDAFDHAVDEVNSSQRGGPYAVPLDFTPNGGVIPGKVRNWAMVIAFEYLYNGRGLDDKNKVGNKITKQLTDTYTEMSLYHSGVGHLNAALATDTAGNVVTGQISRMGRAGSWRRWYWIGDAPVFSGMYCYDN